MLKKKYFMLLLLLLFVLSLGTLSNCYAYTWDDLVEHCSNISNSNVTFQDTINQANLIVRYNQQYLDLLANNNINVNDYHTFVTYKGTSSSSSNILILAKNTINVRFGYLVSGYRYPIYIQNLSNGVKINLDSKTIISTNASGNSDGGNASLGLVEGMTNFGNASFQYYANQYIYSDLLTTTLRGESPYLFAQGVVGYSLFNANYGWYLIQNEEYTKLDEIQEDNDDFIMYGLLLTNEMLKDINKVDNCYLYYGDLTTKRYQSDSFLLDYELIPEETSSGTITNTSGDVTGAIDLSGVENRIDFTNELLQEQTQAILSGDKQLRDSIISGDKQIIGTLTNTNFSGDITMEDLPSVEIDDPSEEFFSWLLTNIEDVILYSGDSVLVIPIYNTQHEIRSDVFKLETEPLKSFISIGWWFVCGIPLLKWVRYTIETIRSGNIPQVDDKSDLLGNVL